MPELSDRFCKAITKGGKPCKAPPTLGGLCYFHANPDQARVLGQKGGRGNRYQVTDVAVPENATMAALGTILEQTLRELLAGRLDPRVATAVAQVVNTRRRLTETLDLVARIAVLERRVADAARAQGEESETPGWIRTEKGDGGGGNAGERSSEA